VARVVDGEYGDGGAVGGRVGPDQVGPDLSAQQEGVLAPRLDAIRRGGGDRAPLVRARQRAHLRPAGGGPAAPAVGRGHRPAEGGILRQPDDVTGRPFLLQQRHPEAGVQHQHLIGGTLPRRLAYQAPRVGAGRLVGGVRPDEGTRHCQPLRSCAADPGDEAERDGRERPAGHAVVVGGWAAAKPRAPEPGTIDRDGPIATMRVGLPLAFPRHHPGPAAD
jgi:hypothetical protein